MFATAFNTTDAPVVVDDEGRTIEGRSWGTIETTTDAAKAAADEGTLQVYPDKLDDAPGQNPDAVDAYHRTAAVQSRARAYSELDTDELARLADDEADFKPRRRHKRDLVHHLALRDDVDHKEAIKRLREALAEEAKAEAAAKAERDKAEAEKAEAASSKKTTSRRSTTAEGA